MPLRTTIYLLSNLFNNEPFYHVGLKAQYAFSNKVHLMAGIINNADNLDDNNRAKEVIAQLFVFSMSGWNVYLNGIISNEVNADAKGKTPNATYSIFNLTTNYQIMPKFLVVSSAVANPLSANYQALTFNPKFVTSSDKWGGIAVYSNYALSDVFSFGARYKIFNDQDVVRGLKFDNNTGGTVS